MFDEWVNESVYMFKCHIYKIYLNNLISTYQAWCLTISPSSSLFSKLAAVPKACLVCPMICGIVYTVSEAFSFSALSQISPGSPGSLPWLHKMDGVILLCYCWNLCLCPQQMPAPEGRDWVLLIFVALWDPQPGLCSTSCQNQNM